MKHVGPIIAVGFTLIVLAAVAVFSLAPQTSSAQSDVATDTPIVIATQAPATAAPTVDMEAQLKQREAAYLAQIDQLNTWFVERQSQYQNQAQELSTQIETGRAQLEALDQQQSQLEEQMKELRRVRKQRKNTYKTQLQDVATQFETRRTTLQQRLDEAKAKLAEANQQLGR